MPQNPINLHGVGAPDATKPYKFIGFGALDATKPNRFTGLGALNATKGGGPPVGPPGVITTSLKMVFCFVA